MKQIILTALLAPNLLAAHAPTVTTLPTPDNGIQPQCTVDAKGVVHLIYFKGEPRAGDIFYVRRGAGQKEFSKPIQVNTQPHTVMAMGTIRGAQLAVGKNGRVHVVWDGMGEGASSASHASHTHAADPSTAHHAHDAHHAPDAAHAHARPHHDAKQPLFYTRLNDTGTAFEPERNVITYAYGLDGGSSVAADPQGNVYVTWHAALPGADAEKGEADRAVFVARSSDEGTTFQREAPAISKPTGACACCGMRAFADSRGDVLALYRTAYDMTNRDETLLISRDKGANFEIAYSHSWHLGTCPMSSATISEAAGQILAAAETHGRVFFVRLDPKTGKVSSPVSPETKAKYPVVIGNSRGEILLAWAEGTGWGKGGAVAWQIYDRDGNPLSNKGHADGLKPWSLPTAFAEPNGDFALVY
jgi:hypothetical protein